MEIIREKISIKDLKGMAENMFGNFLKAVVDVEKKIMAVDAELHADLEALLLENGSEQKNLWGINIYPELHGQDDFVEFNSMINLKPSQGNTSRGVENLDIQKRIREIVDRVITNNGSPA